MISQSRTLTAFTDAAADAVARAIAGFQREAQRETEFRQAEHRARLLEVDLRLAAVADIERKISERLSSLKDGERGEPGPAGESIKGERGEKGEPGESIIGPPGERGLDAPPVDLSLVVERAVAAIPKPKDGEPGPPGASVKGDTGEKGDRGEPGPSIQGERGQEGPPGKLPLVRAWDDRVHYAGDVVSHGGSAYQAVTDTAREPPHDDWRCIAQAGAAGPDGRSFRVRGTWEAKAEYQALDVVALDGRSFLARRDNPGECPGQGWQLIANHGKSGKPGERGPIGPRGEPGAGVKALDIDIEGLLTLTNGDGSAVTCDLYPLLAKVR